MNDTLPDYEEAYIDGYMAIANDRLSLIAPRNPYPEETEAHAGWKDGAIDSQTCLT